MVKRVSRVIATAMLVISAVFLWYALSHPESSFPWSNTVTFILYAAYVLIMIFLFAAPFKKK